MGISHADEDYGELNTIQKIKLVQSFREFAKAFEKSYPVTAKNHTVFLPSFMDAFAAPGESCVIAGWMSTRGATDSCSYPENELFKTQNPTCGEGSIACNPLLFGNNLCIPFTTPVIRDNAFHNCDKKFDKENRSLALVVKDLPKEEFDAYIKGVKDVCLNKSTVQSKTGMCREIMAKFNEYIPSDHSGNLTRLNKALVNGDEAAVDKMLPKIHQEYKDTQALFDGKDCDKIDTKDESQYPKFEECEKLSKRLQKIDSLYSRAVHFLEDSAKEECQIISDQNSAELTVSGLDAAAKTSCNEAEKAQISKDCGKDVACVLGSSIAGPLLMITEAVGMKTNSGCLNNQNNCLANIMSSALRALWGTIKGVWDLLKAGWNWVEEKASRLWTSMWGVEDKTSDAQNLVKNMSEQERDQVSQSPGEWIQGIMTNIWTATQDYLKKDVYCEKWSGSFPGQGACVQPFRGFECMNCGKRITTNCSALGVIVGEVLPALITGGLAGAAKAGAEGANVISKLMKSAKVAGKLSEKIAKVAKPIAKGFVKAGNLAKKVGTPFKYMADKSKLAYMAVKKSPTAVKVNSELVAFSKLKMVKPVVVVVKETSKAVEKVEQKLFNIGQDAVGTVTGTGTKASKVAGKVDEVVNVTNNAPVVTTNNSLIVNSDNTPVVTGQTNVVKNNSPINNSTPIKKENKVLSISREGRDPNEYKEFVSKLKKDDMIQFADGQEFKIEKRLGGESSSEIFLLKDGRVIRINTRSKDTGWATVESFRKGYDDLKDSNIPIVKVLDQNNVSKQYVMVEKLEPKYTFKELYSRKAQTSPEEFKKVMNEFEDFVKSTAGHKSLEDFHSDQIVYDAKRGWLLADYGADNTKYMGKGKGTVFDGKDWDREMVPAHLEYFKDLVEKERIRLSLINP